MQHCTQNKYTVYEKQEKVYGPFIRHQTTVPYASRDVSEKTTSLNRHQNWRLVYARETASLVLDDILHILYEKVTVLDVSSLKQDRA